MGLLFVHWTHDGEQGKGAGMIRFVSAGCWSTHVSTNHTWTDSNNLL